MSKDTSDLTLLTVDLINIIKKCTSYDFDIKIYNEYVNKKIFKKRIKVHYKTEELLTLIINVRDKNILKIDKVKLMFKNRQSQTVSLSDLQSTLESYFSEHIFSNYSLNIECAILVDKGTILDNINSNVTGLELNFDPDTNSKYFNITYSKDNMTRFSGYNSDLLKLYNKKFRGKQPKILKW